MVKPEDISQDPGPEEEIFEAGESIYERIGRKLIYVLVGFTPIFFLPVTIFPVALNKQIFAAALVLSSFVLWLAQTITSGRISFVKCWLNLGVAAMLFVFAVSGLASVAPSQSFWGISGNVVPDSFFGFLIYAVGFYLITFYLKGTEEIFKAFFSFIGGVAMVALYSLFQFFGIYLLPFDFTKAVSFNTVSSVFTLGIFLALGFSVLVSVLTFLRIQGLLKYLLAGLVGLLGFELLLINFKTIWIGILVAMTVILSYKFTRTKTVIQRSSILALIVFVIALFLVIARPALPNLTGFPAEVSPSHSATLDIAKQNLKGVKNILLGTGPATFDYVYGLYRPAALNQTLFWDTRFIQGSSALLTLFATVGILGAASLFFVFLGFLRLVWQGMKKIGSEPHPLEALIVASLSGVLMLISLMFLYGANFTLYFYLFVFMGFASASFASAGYTLRQEISIADSPRKTLFASLTVIVLIAAALAFGYMGGQKYLGAIFYSQSISQLNRGENIDSATKNLVRAANLDQSNSLYLRGLTQALVMKLNQIINDQSLNFEQKQNFFWTNAQNAINVARKATEVNQSDVLNWSNLGWVYENLIILAPGADKLALENYKKALSLDPKSPLRHLEIARAYVASADRAQNDLVILRQAKTKDSIKENELQQTWKTSLDLALIELELAISLKPDYSQAHIFSSQIYDRRGEIDRAIARMTSARQGVFDAITLSGIDFQLGFLYYKKDDLQNAGISFERAVALNPNYSNARYFLGLIYSRHGNQGLAIEQFKIIEALNPDNQEVKIILANLKSGRPPLEGIVPPAEPLQERTEAPVPEGTAEERGLKR